MRWETGDIVHLSSAITFSSKLIFTQIPRGHKRIMICMAPQREIQSVPSFSERHKHFLVLLTLAYRVSDDTDTTHTTEDSLEGGAQKGGGWESEEDGRLLAILQIKRTGNRRKRGFDQQQREYECKH